MKFFKAAVAAVAALASMSEAKVSQPKDNKAWKETLNHRMKNGLYNKEVLMAGAEPHNDAAKAFEFKRNLENFEITADYSIQFISCFSLTTSYDELFENQDNGGGMALQMMQNGGVVPERSYAIFKLCYTSHCDYTTDDPTLEYTIEMGVYVQALVMYLPDQVEQFCEGCQENEESCYAQLYGGYGYAGAYGYNGQAYQYENQQAAENNYNGAYVNNVQYSGAQSYANGYNPYSNNNQQNANAQQSSYNDNGGNRRKLSDITNQKTRRTEQGQVVRQLDCNLCLQYNCIEPQNGNNNWNEDIYGFEAAAEWLTTISQCYQTGAVYSGNGAYYQQGGDNQGNMYAGFICNDEGNGVEIGMFLDEECILYLPNEPFSNYMNLYDSTYQSMTADIIEFTFSDAKFGCKDEEVVYTTQAVDGYNQYYNYDWNGDQDAEAAEWCQYLYDNELGAVPVNMYDCGGNAYGNYYNRYGNNNDDNQYQYMYSWYQFDINEENAIDMEEVCLAVKQANGQLHTFFNGNNGHMYNYGSSNGASQEITEFVEGSGTSTVTVSKKRSLSGGAKFGIIAAVGVLVGALVAVVLKVRSGSSDKKEPLIAEELEQGEQADGTMA